MPSGKVASTCRVLLSTGISSVRSTLLSDCRRRSRRRSSSCCCWCCCRRCRSGPPAPASRGRELNGFPTPNPTRPLSTAHGSDLTLCHSLPPNATRASDLSENWRLPEIRALCPSLNRHGNNGRTHRHRRRHSVVVAVVAQANDHDH